MGLFGFYTQLELMNARADGHNTGFVKGCEQAEGIARQIAAGELAPMRELLIQRRGECPKGSPFLAVQHLVNCLELEEQRRDGIAKLLWEIVARYVPDADLPEINQRVLPFVGHRNLGSG